MEPQPEAKVYESLLRPLRDPEGLRSSDWFLIKLFTSAFSSVANPNTGRHLVRPLRSAASSSHIHPLNYRIGFGVALYAIIIRTTTKSTCTGRDRRKVDTDAAAGRTNRLNEGVNLCQLSLTVAAAEGHCLVVETQGTCLHMNELLAPCLIS